MNIKHIAVCLVISVSAILSGCVSPDDGALRWIDGSIRMPSEEHVRSRQEFLLNTNDPSEFDKTIGEGVVFDGTVERISVNFETGLHKVTFAIDALLYGDYADSNNIIVMTPSVRNGGVYFEENKKYRVLAIYMKNAFRTWASAGTVEIPLQR